MTRDQNRIDRRSPLNIREGSLCGLLPALLIVATGARTLPAVLKGGLVDPDSYMRLVRLEDGMRQGAPAYFVARDGSGAGTLLHWSHLLDLLLLVVAAPFRLVMDMHAALHAAAVIFGPLGLAALGIALAWAIVPVAQRRWIWLAPVAMALSPSVGPYGLPGVAHHHVLLVVVAVMMAGYALRGAMGLARPGAGLSMGTWAGFGIWLSPEAMPFILLAFGGLWLAWLQQRDIASMIGETASAFLLVVISAFAIDAPYAGYASIEIDRLSVVYVGLALAVSVAGIFAWARAGKACSIWVGIAVPVFCLGAWLAAFPIVIRGPDGLMAARDSRAMLNAIVEMMPVRNIAEGVEYLLTGILGVIALTWLGLSKRSWLLGYAALCAGVLVVLGALHVRFAVYPCTAAAAMLPVLITLCAERFESWSDTALAGARVGLMTTFILLPGSATMPWLLSSAAAASAEPAPTCELSNIATMLRGHGGQVVMANPNDSPELLYRTKVLTVGSIYHRNVAAFMRLRSAWRSRPSTSEPESVRATTASLLLFCHSTARSLLVADLPDDTLFDRLNQGRVPAWLHEISEDKPSGNILYEVLP